MSTHPASSGVLIYAKNLTAMAAFYQAVLDAAVLQADTEHQLLQSAQLHVVVHAIPAEYASAIVIDCPPEPREEQAIKPLFAVTDLAASCARVEALGGRLLGPRWPGPPQAMRQVCDPEGNIIELRQLSAADA